jgi:hypothetical protein
MPTGQPPRPPHSAILYQYISISNLPMYTFSPGHCLRMYAVYIALSPICLWPCTCIHGALANMPMKYIRCIHRAPANTPKNPSSPISQLTDLDTPDPSSDHREAKYDLQLTLFPFFPASWLGISGDRLSRPTIFPDNDLRLTTN